MKKILLSILLAALFLPGCVVISLPGIKPLEEKAVGGSGDDKIVLIDISGKLIDGSESRGLGLIEKRTLTARVKEELDMAARDKAVKAVILRIDSPGGSVTTSDIINHEIKKFKDKKKAPVVAELLDLAASGGYYVAVAADSIVAHPTTVTGSIGVIAYNVNASGLLKKIGITDETIKSGELKDIGSPLRELTDKEKAVLQSVINSLYEQFITTVLEGRKGLLEREELMKVADGRILTAKQALDAKLIDSIGYTDDAVDIALKRAGIKEARLIKYSSPGSYKHNIYSMLENAPSTVNVVNIDAGDMVNRLGMRFMYLWQ